MKIITVLGAKPQFIKAALVSRELRKKHTEIIMHTGQHYNHELSDIFFEEMNIPQPEAAICQQLQKRRIIQAARSFELNKEQQNIFGDGKAGEKICKLLVR